MEAHFMDAVEAQRWRIIFPLSPSLQVVELVDSRQPFLHSCFHCTVLSKSCFSLRVGMQGPLSFQTVMMVLIKGQKDSAALSRRGTGIALVRSPSVSVLTTYGVNIQVSKPWSVTDNRTERTGTFGILETIPMLQIRQQILCFYLVASEYCGHSCFLSSRTNPACLSLLYQCRIILSANIQSPVVTSLFTGNKVLAYCHQSSVCTVVVTLWSHPECVPHSTGSEQRVSP